MSKNVFMELSPCPPSPFLLFKQAGILKNHGATKFKTDAVAKAFSLAN